MQIICRGCGITRFVLYGPGASTCLICKTHIKVDPEAFKKELKEDKDAG